MQKLYEDVLRVLNSRVAMLEKMRIIFQWIIAGCVALFVRRELCLVDVCECRVIKNMTGELPQEYEAR